MILLLPDLSHWISRLTEKMTWNSMETWTVIYVSTMREKIRRSKLWIGIIHRGFSVVWGQEDHIWSEVDGLKKGAFWREDVKRNTCILELVILMSTELDIVKVHCENDKRMNKLRARQSSLVFELLITESWMKKFLKFVNSEKSNTLIRRVHDR